MPAAAELKRAVMSGGDETETAATPSVLVVDDYPPNRIAMRALLAPVATITEAESGERAIEEIARKEYAVVVLDIQMPGMSGVEVARRIRAGGHNAHVPIIFVTAMDAEMAPFLEGYAVGAVDFLRRPIDSVILRAKVSVFAELYQRREDASRAAAERARLEVERVEAERVSRLKDRLLAVLSHELRTPLTSILLWSDMLLHKPLSAETVRQGIGTIDLCARHEARLVDNVLEMSHLLAGTMILDSAAVDVGELVAEVVAEIDAFANDRGVRVVSFAETGRWPAVGDRTRLRHVLFNLLENAVKFTPKGGYARVSVDNLEDLLHIRVSDTGMGFPAGCGPTLFERFAQADQSSTRAHGGLGMGLATAKALVELHGGALTAASDGPGLGATFTVTLPPAGPEPIAPGSSP